MIQVEKGLVRKFSEILPDRKRGKRGPNPIAKEALVEGLFLRLMTGVAWNKIRHSASIRRYFQELQRR